MITCLKSYANQWVEIPGHLGMFGGHWSSASGDKKYIICQVTSQKQVIEISGNFIGGSSSLYVTTLPSLVARGIVIVDVPSLPRDLARLRDERAICLYELEALARYVTNLPSLVAIGTVVLEK